MDVLQVIARIVDIMAIIAAFYAMAMSLVLMHVSQTREDAMVALKLGVVGVVCSGIMTGLAVLLFK